MYPGNGETATVRGNWVSSSNIQVLINHKYLADYLESQGLLGAYDLFVFTRCDLLHLLPFPPVEQLMSVLHPTDVLTQAEYLRAPHEFIMAGRGMKNNRCSNIECLWKLLLKERNWWNVRMSITCFISAETLEDRITSKKKIRSSRKHGGVLYKYATQMEEAYKSLKLWECQPAWRCFRSPRTLQVEETHGRARRMFACALAAAVRNEEADVMVAPPVGSTDAEDVE
eukprot:gnl/TRDRNA2_/TRDRNA2_126468_c0_seq3.p1 gnl/TRDRNA2_/TRDRNA2_126468_c0~~gnl/TRDRNA2_/TRDRNA2_126468_c0_seq3.p1  ORF type:complete len:227 (+),score=35.06 gnl/TRDRNA2_/TRDRNA2_126468_c0_seq3:361-1041(+)